MGGRFGRTAPSPGMALPQRCGAAPSAGAPLGLLHPYTCCRNRGGGGRRKDPRPGPATAEESSDSVLVKN